MPVIKYLLLLCYCGKTSKDENGVICGIHWGDEEGIRNLGRKPEWKRSLERPKCRWEGNIKSIVNK